MPNLSHKERINAELLGVGATKRAIDKFSKRSLHETIHSDEHITGVLYGRYGEGSFNWYGGMMVATDRRMIFFDLTPWIRDFTELTYEVVTAIDYATTGPFAGVTVHTGVKDYSLKFVDTHSAEVFVQYVEQRRLESAGTFNPNMYEEQEEQSKREQGRD